MHRISLEDAKDYLLSGSAFVTMLNTQPLIESESQYSFSIRQKRDKLTRYPQQLWYVYRNGDYLGYIRNNVFAPGDTARVLILHKKAVKVFNYVWKRIVHQCLEDNIELLHSGKCGHCGRALTDAISIKLGIGPECRRKLGITSQLKLSV